MTKEQYLYSLKIRYERRIGGHPEIKFAHFGDCDIWNIGICTCGLLNDLQALYGYGEDPEKFYPDFSSEDNKYRIIRDMLMSGKDFKER